MGCNSICMEVGDLPRRSGGFFAFRFSELMGARYPKYNELMVRILNASVSE